jgi:D-alanine-D-alanine ligase
MDGHLTAMEGCKNGSPLSTTLEITVLMGGPSSEREVSLASGRAVADALESRGHRVTRADISPTDVSALDRPGMDVVFIALHGEFGESGHVQKLCEQRGLRYIGSGPRASELSLNKAAAKQRFKREGIPTPDWMVIEQFHPRDAVAGWLAELPPPVVVKPVDGGSSVDVTIARDDASRDRALDELLDSYGRAMLERYVPGRELTVGILGERALPVIEIVPAESFYDYRAKYADDAGTGYRFDHGLGAEPIERLQELALRAHRALDCRDLSRVDFILPETGPPAMLEINTIPGFTSHSLLPKAAAEAGIGFEQLVEQIVALALSR